MVLGPEPGLEIWRGTSRHGRDFVGLRGRDKGRRKRKSRRQKWRKRKGGRTRRRGRKGRRRRSGSGIGKQTALKKSLLIGKKNQEAWLGLGLVLRLSYPNNDSSP